MFDNIFAGRFLSDISSLINVNDVESSKFHYNSCLLELEPVIGDDKTSNFIFDVKNNEKIFKFDAKNDQICNNLDNSNVPQSLITWHEVNFIYNLIYNLFLINSKLTRNLWEPQIILVNLTYNDNILL